MKWLSEILTYVHTNDSIHLYAATHIPIVSYVDELIAKLVSYSHNPSMMVIGGSARFNRALNLKPKPKPKNNKWEVFCSNNKHE